MAISVSIDGNRAVVGARAHSLFGGTGFGSAYVIRRDDNGTPDDTSDDIWVEQAKLTASDADFNDQFGSSVSISGDRMIVGAWNHNNTRGSAYVFRRDDNGTPLDPSDDWWVEEGKLLASDGSFNDQFGRAVSISGDRAIVGSYLEDEAGSDAGAAYVFRRDDNGTPMDPTDDF